ncbi:putative ribonuclease H-like domain-containing protein [Tanacetum coccineum]|uniref:Ribonuclease H-like domain-containing protein n=1 Tax=Tanacetum coccineum TaxID=301880 RepID=A0ABQ5A183_9ASTR
MLSSRKDNMYIIDLKNVVPQGGLTCLFAKATPDDSNLWHRRLRYVNFKTMNKLVKGNLVRGLPLKLFEINQTCVACQKGKQHIASCKTKTISLISKPLQMCTSGFCWAIICKEFNEIDVLPSCHEVLGIENLIYFKVKVIRCDNVTEFKNRVMNQFCEMKGRKPALSFIRPFGCPVTILNTIDHLGNQSNGSAGTKACNDAGKARMETVPGKDYILLPVWPTDLLFSQSSKVPSTEESRVNQEKDASVNNTNTINTVSQTVNAACIEDNDVDENIVYGCADDPNMPELEDIVYSDDDEDVGAEADMNNLDTFMSVSPILSTRIHKDHPIEQIIVDLNSAPQTRRMTKSVTEHVMFSSVQERTNHRDFQNCLFACFLSQEKPKKVWTLMDLPNGKRAIGTKWVYMNKKDERAIGLFLAYASFKDFVVYQMDVKSAFLYGNIEKEVCVYQPPGFEDLDFLDRVYKVGKGFSRGKIDKTLFIRRDKGDILLVQVYVDVIIFGSTKKSLCTEFEKMMHKKFQVSSMGELTFFLGLQVKRRKMGIFISQDSHVTKILKILALVISITEAHPMETHKLYSKMQMYVLAEDFQVNPESSLFHDVKRIKKLCRKQVGWMSTKGTLSIPRAVELISMAMPRSRLWSLSSTTEAGILLLPIAVDSEINPVSPQRQSTLRLGITLSEIPIRRSLFR